MKKALALIVALFMAPVGANATWLAYYTGESYLTYPGLDALGLAPTFIGNSRSVLLPNVDQPTSPNPPQGLKWLWHSTCSNGGCQANMFLDANENVSYFNSAQGQYVIFFRTTNLDPGNNTSFEILRISNNGNDGLVLQYKTQFGSMHKFNVFSNVANYSGPDNVNANQTYKLKLTYDGSGTSLTIDDGAPITDTNVVDLTDINQITVGTVSITNPGRCYIDALAFSNATGDSFPPTIPTPSNTPTPTPTVTPTNTVTRTFTNSPTITVTFTKTPTLTKTTSVTKTTTRTPSATRTRTQTGTKTLTKTYTATPTNTRTSTFTNTGTITPSITQTRTITATSTITVTRTITPSITETNTITVTSTISATSTITPTYTRTSTATSTKTVTVTPTISNTPLP